MKRQKNPITSAINSALTTYIFGVIVCIVALLHFLGLC